MLRYMELKKKKKKRRIEMWCVKKIIRSVYDKKNVNNFFGWILNISYNNINYLIKNKYYSLKYFVIYYKY